MVHQTRLELARVAPYAPQAYVSADSTTGASLIYITIALICVNNFFSKVLRILSKVVDHSVEKADT